MSAGKASFEVGGRKYSVACEAGQEDDVASLGAVIDGKLSQLDGNLAPQDAQNMLMAALFLADELREAKATVEKTAGHDTRIEELSDRVEQLKTASAASAQELEALRKEADEQRARADKAEAIVDAGATNTQSSVSAPHPAADDPNLAPALERFAEMLEECADKLEGKAATP